MKSRPTCISIEQAYESRINKRIAKLHKKLLAVPDRALVQAVDSLPASDLVLLAEFEQGKAILGSRYTKLSSYYDKRRKT